MTITNGHPEILTFHRALNASNGGQIRQDLNRLTTLLRKLSLAESLQQGDHVARLARRLPIRILRAAIRDQRFRRAEFQNSVNYLWIRLYHTINDEFQWDMLIAQKDKFYFSAVQSATSHLRKKFTSLFVNPPDCVYCLLPARTGMDRDVRDDVQRDVANEPRSRSAVSDLLDATQICDSPVSPLQNSPDSLSRSGSASLTFWSLDSDSLQHTCCPNNATVLSDNFPSPAISFGSVAGSGLLDQGFLCADNDSLPSLPQEEIAASTMNILSQSSARMQYEEGDEFQLADPSVPIPLPAPEASEDLIPLADLVWGMNVPVLEDRDERLCHHVVNLSGRRLTNDQQELLSFGLRFRFAPKRIPTLKVIAGIEGAAQDLGRQDLDQANWFKSEAARILHHSRSSYSNLPVNLRKASKQLRLDSSLVVTKSDKGGRTVVLLATHYGAMCGAHLDDEAYVCVDSFGSGRHKVSMVDPKTKLDRELLNGSFTVPDVTDRLLRLQCTRLDSLLRSLASTRDVSHTELRKLCPQHPYGGVVPRFYGLPKLHKVGRLTIRPIITNCGHYCDDAMLHMKGILNLLPNRVTSVAHSYELSQILDNFNFPDSAFLVSFDVVSLFTRVPIPETLKIVEKRLLRLKEQQPELLAQTTSLTVSGIMRLLTFLLEDCYFVWAKHLYRQINGLPMGGRLSPVLAGIFMEELEEEALNFYPVAPLLYKRYVDDIIVIWDLVHGSYTGFLEILNSRHPNIRLTVEEERQGVLPFLDLLITRPNTTVGRKFSLQVYRKSTHSDSYVHYRSSHPFSAKKNVMNCLLLRAYRLLRNHPDKLKIELNYLQRAFCLERNGYPRTVVQKWMNSFRRELDRNPSKLDLPVKTGLPLGTDSQVQNQLTVYPVRKWLPTLITPYVPNLSEKLRSVASRCGVRSWFTYGGKVGDSVCQFKDKLHLSKSSNSVYSVSCSCGTHYVGKSGRNLKIRIHEHCLASSKSTLSLHVRAENDRIEQDPESTEDRHEIDGLSTFIISQERNARKRRLMESICIKSKAAKLCNIGGSVSVSDIWDPSLPKIARLLRNLD